MSNGRATTPLARGDSGMTPNQALTFVKTNGIVLESGRGSVAGGPLKTRRSALTKTAPAGDTPVALARALLLRQVASLAEAVAGGPIRGSWWAHPKGHEIFLCSRAVRESPDVLVCRLVGGKITYVHRRLWPALVRLAEDFDSRRLAAICEVHTPSGKHKVITTPFPEWVPKDVMRAAKRLTREEAARLMKVAYPAKRSRRN
jgi:hypothetical protein